MGDFFACALPPQGWTKPEGESNINHALGLTLGLAHESEPGVGACWLRGFGNLDKITSEK